MLAFPKEVTIFSQRRKYRDRNNHRKYAIRRGSDKCECSGNDRDPYPNQDEPPQRGLLFRHPDTPTDEKDCVKRI